MVKENGQNFFLTVQHIFAKGTKCIQMGHEMINLNIAKFVDAIENSPDDDQIHRFHV